MKKLLLLTALACTGSLISQAQLTALHQNYSATAFVNSKAVSASVFSTTEPAVQTRARVKTEEHWRKLRNNGIVLTSLGAACITVGAVLINADVYDVDGKADGTRAVFGIMGIAGGITSLGGGITMWAIGNNRLKKLQGFSLQSNGSSMGVVYKF